MFLRISNLIKLFDFAIGGFFALATFGIGMTAFAVTGGPLKPYEMQAVSNVYTGFLVHVERGARALRADFCTKVDGATAMRAKCGSARALLGGRSLSEDRSLRLPG